MATPRFLKDQVRLYNEEESINLINTTAAKLNKLANQATDQVLALQTKLDGCGFSASIDGSFNALFCYGRIDNCWGFYSVSRHGNLVSFFCLSRTDKIRFARALPELLKAITQEAIEAGANDVNI